MLPEEDAGDQPEGHHDSPEAVQGLDEGAAAIKKRFTSVWEAIEDTPQQAAGMRARSDLMMALQEWVRVTGKTQAEAARLFAITQPRMSDLMRGKINLFGLESLMDMATAAGLDPHVTVKKPKAPRKRQGTELAAA